MKKQEQQANATDTAGNLSSTVVRNFTIDSVIQEDPIIPGNPDNETPTDPTTVVKLINEIHYSYDNSNWKDQLTSYNGKAITYDAIGNPLTYDGNTYTWQNGRQLKNISNQNLNISYTYNDNGIRESKTVNGVTTKYYLEGSKVIYEKTGNDIIYYSYDEMGEVVGLNRNGTQYYYIRNAQGDIVGVLDNNLNKVVEYTYDSWGIVISVKNAQEQEITDLGNIGLINPYRYRGYRYDSETGLYYLQSRYYNPTWGRFLNADGVVSDAGAGLIGHNMYVYCANNPATYYDPTGKSIAMYQSKFQVSASAGNPIAQEVVTNVANGGSVTTPISRTQIPTKTSGGSQVYIGTHNVAQYLPASHASIIIVGYSGDKYSEKFIDGYATIGADGQNGKLISNINRGTDRNFSKKNGLISLGVWDTATVDLLFELDNNYNDNENYAYLPITSYNSNSYAHGLLNAVGVYPNKPNQWVPGWNRPLPKSYFGL